MEILKNYFYFVLHPSSIFRSARNFESSKDSRVLQFPKGENNKFQKLNFYQITTSSWSFHLIYSIYSVLLIYLSFEVFAGFKSASDSLVLTEFFSRTKFFFKRAEILYILLMSVFFPIYLYTLQKLWVFIISLIDKNVFSENSSTEDIHTIVNYSFCGHFFLIIPVFGPLITKFASVLYLYLGLRRVLGYSFAQAFLIIVCPAIIFISLAFLMLFVSLLSFNILVFL